MKLQELPNVFAICKLDSNSDVPKWVYNSHFFSITKTPEELSIVCEQSVIPSGVPSEQDWKAFKVVGTLDFSLTGILASIANPLADKKISIFAISTFDTDYILVKNKNWKQAIDTLQGAGFSFE